MTRRPAPFAGAFMALALAALGRPATATPTPSFAFRSIGPAVSGGRVTAVAGSNSNLALYYIGGAGGGIYKTTNGGFDWTPVFDQARVAPIGALALDAHDDDVVWAGTGEANPRNDVSSGDGVYRSTDGGKTWAHVGLVGSAQISSISVDPRDGRTALVGVLGDPFADSNERGVYRTSDAGTTWTRTLFVGPSSGASDLARDPRDPRVVYAGIWQVRRHAWSLASGGTADGLFRSNDGGRTWTRLSGHGLPSGPLGRIGLAIAPSDHRRIYALIQSPHGLLWRSDDAGATWRMISSNTLINQRPFYFSRIFVDPTNPNHVISDSVHLTESRDGGKTWRSIGERLHGDHHALFIASDGRRMLSGGDGGAGLSLDGGRTWTRMNYAALGQVYHVGFDLEDPYRVCVAQQDDGTFCAPSVGADDRGIVSRDWLKVAGGDGTHVWPDPLDPHLVWYSNGGEDNEGSLGIYDTRTLETFNASPYLRDQNVVAPKDLAYRFNWEAPIAFSPQDGHVAYFGGNVVFETSDRGRTWRVISPDLTRDIKAHQVITGGPITLEGTGAETADTLLAIAPSAARPGEIWTGSDDGLVHLTRDAGATWRDVSIPRLDAAARIECIDPSRMDPGLAYASADRHFVGDRTPYVFVTHDFGATWRRIDAGLPRDQFVRCIRADPRNPSVLYAGLEQSLWFSLDGGASWERLRAGLPPASVRDLQVHPQANDLIVGTHGRGAWILDDVAALQHLAAARAAGTYLFEPKPAVAYTHHEETFEHLGAGANPAGAALITLYRRTDDGSTPRIVIVDARGGIVRHLDGPKGTGILRVAWDLTEDAPTPWRGAPSWNRGPDGGAPVVRGTYTVRARVNGRTLRAPLDVRADPRAPWTRDDDIRRHAFLATLYGMLDGIDVALNRLDAVDVQAEKRAAAPLQPSVRRMLDGAVQHGRALSALLTNHMRNDQDNDFLTDVLRERVQALIGAMDGSGAPPTAPALRELAALQADYRARMDEVAAYFAGDVPAANRALHAAGAAEIDPDVQLAPPEGAQTRHRARHAAQ